MKIALRRTQQAGFTLMELIAGLAVVAVVVTGALGLR
jgi:prepilin-type N-terminal cleavage/methylation domain-containing protein